MKGRRFLAALATLFVVPASGQAEDYCAKAYENRIASVSLKTRSFAEYDYVFNTHCEIDGAVRKESFQADLTIAIKVVSPSFAGTRQQALEAMPQFCKSRAPERPALSDSFDNERNIVIAALKGLNECRAWESAVCVSRNGRLFETGHAHIQINRITEPFMKGANKSIFGPSPDKDGPLYLIDYEYLFSDRVNVYITGLGTVPASGSFVYLTHDPELRFLDADGGTLLVASL